MSASPTGFERHAASSRSVASSKRSDRALAAKTPARIVEGAAPEIALEDAANATEVDEREVVRAAILEALDMGDYDRLRALAFRYSQLSNSSEVVTTKH